MFLNKVCLFGLLAGFFVTMVAGADICQVTSKTYSAGDGMVLVNTAHIITFQADCPKDVVPVYASLNDRTFSVVQTDDKRSYQISWITDLSKATSGDYQISVFDDNGFQQFKKSQRSGSGGDVKQSLFTLSYKHSAPYRGQWFQTEFYVLIVVLVTAYYAVNLRLKIGSKQI